MIPHTRPTQLKDVNQLANHLVDVATGVESDEGPQFQVAKGSNYP